jgi:carboxymethylenebutenolidase
MPVYEPTHIEYAISSGFIQVVVDGGAPFPAYHANPKMGGRFPCIALIHDWWGLTSTVRHLANTFAQAGLRVIVPDLFDGQIASTAQTALNLVVQLGARGGVRVAHALDVMEHHHHSNGAVAAVGIGMGGGLAFDAALKRADLEAAVAFAGMPQAYLGRFAACKTPILAVYGAQDALIPPDMIGRLRDELAAAELGTQHRVEVIDGLGHELFSDTPTPTQAAANRTMMRQTLAFLKTHLDKGRATAKPPRAR